MTEKRKLGRGLEALLSSGSSETMASLLGKPRDTTNTELAVPAQKESELKHVPIELIQRGKYQPRMPSGLEAILVMKLITYCQEIRAARNCQQKSETP